MEDFLNEIRELWWIKVGTKLKNPKSEECIRGLKTVLRENFELDNDVIQYIVEALTNSPSNFSMNVGKPSGINVGDNQTAVSAQLHPDWDDEDETIYNTDLDEDEEEKDDETEKDGDRPDSGDDKEDAEKDIQKQSLTALEKDKLKEVVEGLGVLLSEASVFDSKYAVGDKFLALTNTSDLFKQGLPPSEKSPKGPFTKTSPIDDAIEVNLGSGKVVYVTDDASGKTYMIKGSEGKIKSMFGKMRKGKKPTDINWNTDTLETAAAMGLYVNGFGILKDLNASKSSDDLPNIINSVKSTFQKALSMSGEYSSPNNILSKLDTMSLGDFFLTAQLMAGMTKFTQGVVKFKPYLIHKSIKDYYKATERSELVDGVKDNTADVVVSSVPGSELISALNDGKQVEFDSKGICSVKGTNIKFLQISLKKAEGEAQLGKIYGFLKDKYGLLSNDDLKSLALENVQLNEGLSDFFSKGVSFIKNIGTKLMEKISQIGKLLSGMFKKIEKGFQKSPKSEMKRLEKELLKAGLHEGVLNEAKTPSIYESFEEIAKNQSVLDKLVDNTNKELSALSSTAMKNPAFYYDGFSKIQVKAPTTKDKVAKLLTNFQSAIVVKNMLGDLSADAKTLYSQMVDLEKEMIYGKSKLPLFKVYGLSIDGKGTPYETYPGSEEFVKEKISGDLTDVVVFYFNTTKQDGYFTMTGYGLNGISSTTGELKYSKFRMGTNDSGRYSYTFEGVSEVPLGKVLQTLRKNIS
tara:strand:- start:5503 stop:7740 length:2238 start_codon:yes stop_codon:yes gene_type:complete